MPRSRSVISLAMLALVVLVAAPPGTADSGFRTKVPPMLTLGPDAPVGSNVKAIISTGDVFDGFMFEGIPDGVGVINDGSTARVFVTHEQSRVPFPVATATVTGLRDFVDSSISRLVVSGGGKVYTASVALPPTEGLIRFCSAFMAGPAEGFDEHVFFANEESDDDLAVPASPPSSGLYGPDPFFAPAGTREAGYAVALDVASGTYDIIPGMGRMNHENTVVVPGGWNDVIALTSDDTFAAPSSQLYLYKAASPEDLVADNGGLFAFRVTSTGGAPIDPTNAFNGANDYGDIVLGNDWRGEFIPVPPGIADGTDPVDSTAPGAPLPAMAPQAALERWSNRNNVFQFIRVEDIAYDKNEPNVVYFADTGERRARPDLDPSDLDAPDGRLDRGPSSFVGPYPNGRIFRMEFDPGNPLAVVSFSILLNNDIGGLNNPAAMHQPDNIDTSANSLMVQEDSAQAPFSRVWRYDFATQTWSVVASVNAQAWESSGIVNASDAFGPGAWLVTVQAHDLFVNQSGPIPAPGTTVDKREGGQLLLVRFPGT